MLTYLEDYLEFIGGYRDSQGKVNSWSIPQVSLANYDRNVVDSMANQTLNGRGLTDRQHQLAEKIVNKYRRQCAKLGVTIPESLSLRIPIRQIDRSQCIEHDIDNNQLIVKFRYDDKLVSELREFGSYSCGQVVFDREVMAWRVGLSQPNLMWMWSWAQDRNFELRFDPAVLSQELSQYQREYEIDIDSEGQLSVLPEISNINTAELGSSFLQKLYHSSRWQIPYSENIRRRFADHYREHWYEWTVERQLHIRPSQFGVGALAQWIKELDIGPVVWQDNDPEFLNRLSEVFGQEQVHQLPDKYRKNSVPDRKITVYYTNKLNTSTVRHLPDISLLITDNSIIYGVKNLFQNRINKLIYYGEQQLVEAR